MRSAVSRILCTDDVVPSVWRDLIHYCRNPVTYIGLEPPGISCQTTQDDGAVSPSISIQQWQVESVLNMMQKSGKDLSTTELQIVNG